MSRVCKTRYCRKKAKVGRTICCSCISNLYKERHPLKYAYNTLRVNARRRQKEFTLTLEQFKEFCAKTDYFHKKGKLSHSYHIDRIDESKGYSIDNIQVLTNKENVTKYLTYSVNELGKPDYFKVVSKKPSPEDENNPF